MDIKKLEQTIENGKRYIKKLLDTTEVTDETYEELWDHMIAQRGLKNLLEAFKKGEVEEGYTAEELLKKLDDCDHFYGIEDWEDKDTDTSGLKDGQMALGFYKILGTQDGCDNDKGFKILHWNAKYKEWNFYSNNHWMERSFYNKNIGPDFWIKLDQPEGALS